MRGFSRLFWPPICGSEGILARRKSPCFECDVAVFGYADLRSGQGVNVHDRAQAPPAFQPYVDQNDDRNVAELAGALQQYANAYEDVYGTREAVSDLIPYMLSAFIKSDGGFAQMAKGTPSVDAAASSDRALLTAEKLGALRACRGAQSTAIVAAARWDSPKSMT